MASPSIAFVMSSSADMPPPFYKKADTARWLTDSIGMGALSTTSVHLHGTAFANPYSFADMPCTEQASPVQPGQLFFYATELDTSFQDLAVDARASLTVSLQMYSGDNISLAQVGDYCSAHPLVAGGDPEDPRCARMTISGRMRKTTGSESAAGKEALFAKHPAMTQWPAGHQWSVFTLDISDVWLIDMFGGATILTHDDYYGAACPQHAALDHLPVPSVSAHDGHGPVGRPPWAVNETVHTARWLAHNSDYGVLATTSLRLGDSPFGNPQSVVDGPVTSSTGRLFFYVSDLDASMQDISANPNCSFAMSEAWLDNTGSTVKSCLQERIDPEDPTCVRLVVSGQMKTVDKADADYEFAHGALFARHPSMKSWPADHSWIVVELVASDIWMIDFYGGAKAIAPKDYYVYSLHL